MKKRRQPATGQRQSQFPPEDTSPPEKHPAKSPSRLPFAQTLKRVRGMKMFEALVLGWSIEEVAIKFRTTRRGVKQHMNLIEREGLLEDAQDQVLKDILPLALAAYKKNLTRAAETGDVTAARDIVKETKIAARAGGLLDKLGEGETIEELILRRRRAALPEQSVPQLPERTETANVIDGQLVEGMQQVQADEAARSVQERDKG